VKKNRTATFVLVECTPQMLEKISFVFEMYIKGKIVSPKAMSQQRLGRKGISKATAAITHDTLEYMLQHLKYRLDVCQATDRTR
jgi:hypothetical protein